ncbi:MAG: ROK family protein [Anaerolineales bacterium]
MTDLFAGIEAGGTKWICMIAASPEDIRATSRLPTTQPAETIGAAIEFIQSYTQLHGKLKGLGIGSFGPLDLDSDSPTYGYLTTTPKPGWANTDLVSPIQEALELPLGIDTDVNTAALGESRWGAAQGLSDFIYLTIGTGIGGGGMVNAGLIHGLVHPEMGHLRIPHDWEADPFPGVCPYHGDCLEGLATGPAIEARWGQKGETLPRDHPAWQLEAHYLALGLVNLICTLSPQRIIIGGGVMDQDQLFPMIRVKVQELLSDYISSREILEHIDDYIVPPQLGSQAGVLGAIALAHHAAEDLA